MTYKGYLGYMPMVGHLAENGLVAGGKFREGNQAPSSRKLEFIKYCESQLPKGRHIKAFRTDSASYQADIINYCHDKGIIFAMGGDLDQAVVRQINNLKESEWRVYQNWSIAELVYCMNETERAFRLIVIRRPVQGLLFDGDEQSRRYTMIAINHEEKAEEVVRWYNYRDESSENRIKDLKSGSYMRRRARLCLWRSDLVEG